MALTAGGLIAAMATTPAQAASARAVQVHITDMATNQRLSRAADLRLTSRNGTANRTIVVDPTRRYQTMTGFGASLTDSSAHVINGLPTTVKARAMADLFSPTQGIGLSVNRNPMGASDFSSIGQYSYDDRPAGQTDPALANFSVDHDRQYIIPLILQAQALNPKLVNMATPWSPPGWMKTSDNMTGGTLKPEFYAAYADYFVKYLKAYNAAGVKTPWITVQNEPLYAPDSYPGMVFTADEAQTFIGQYLGPRLKAAGLFPATGILGYDHNWDVPAYPQSLYANQQTSPYVPGTAWHCYGGDVSAQTLTHNAYPNKQAFETECSGGEWQGTPQQAMDASMNSVIEVPRNYGQSVVLWNMALNDANGPTTTTGGCQTCRGVITVHADGTYTKELDYYALGQASKFVKPGAVRIASSIPSSAPNVRNVAFVNPDQSMVVVAYNKGDTTAPFSVQVGRRSFSTSLAPHAAGTYVFHNPGAVRPATDAQIGWTDLRFGQTCNPTGPRQVSVSPDLIASFNQVKVGSTRFASSLPTGGVLNPGVTYEVIPNTGYVATASSYDNVYNNDVPSKAVDGNPATRWASGHGLTPGDWFQVDTGKATTFDQVILGYAASPTDYPRSLQVQVSNDGTTWTTIWQGSGSNSQTVIDVPQTTARYVKVVNESSSGSWWSIHEFNLGVAVGTPQAPTGQRALVTRTASLPDGTRVTAVYNRGSSVAVSTIAMVPGMPVTYSLPAGGVATFAWIR